MNRTYWCFIVFIALFSCSERFPGYKEMESGLYFKLLTLSDSVQRAQKNDQLQVRLIATNMKDSVLFKRRALLEMKNFKQKGGMSEALSLLQEGESGSFIFPFSKLGKSFKRRFPKDLRDTTMLKWDLQIDHIFTAEEFEKEKKAFVEWVRTTAKENFDVRLEEEMMDEFEREHGISTEKTVTGLRYFFIRKEREGEKAGFGKAVKIKYQGKFFNGKVFNSTEPLENGMQDFYIGQEMQVIKGLEEALLLMNEGDAVMLLIPSWLAFGKKGSSTGIVPPKTPVLYELELFSVN